MLDVLSKKAILKEPMIFLILFLTHISRKRLRNIMQAGEQSEQGQFFDMTTIKLKIPTMQEKVERACKVE